MCGRICFVILNDFLFYSCRDGLVPWIHFMPQVVKKQSFWKCFQAPTSMMQSRKKHKMTHGIRQKGRRFMTSSLYQCSPRSHCTWSMSLRFHQRKYGNLQLYCANAQEGDEGASKAGATS